MNTLTNHPAQLDAPLAFEPILKRLLWGGRRLGTLLGKALGPECDYAESWEIADHGTDVSHVVGGAFDGTSLRDLIERHPVELMGPALSGLEQFPLLVKFLDANQVLSVQVHPDDAMAMRLAGDNGKTECWVILHADPGSIIYAGLRRGVTRTSLERAAGKSGVEPLLHSFEPAAGDCVFIPAGTVHAIGSGVVLAEIQQQSDTTYRIHDWGRVGAGGKPRELHLSEALEATDFERGPVDPVATVARGIPGGVAEALVRCDAFELDRLVLDAATPVGSSERFTILLGLEGSASVRWASGERGLTRGQTLLLPAAMMSGEVVPAGKCKVLACVVP